MITSPYLFPIPLALGLVIFAAGILIGAFVYAIAHRRYLDLSTGPGKAVGAVVAVVAIVGAAWSIANLA